MAPASRTPDYSDADPVRWGAVDAYFEEQLAPADPALDAALTDNAAAGLPPQDVSALQGQMLALLVRLSGGARVLEVGTLGGYSTIWLARALPAGGQVFSLEIDQHHADVARACVDDAGVGAAVDIHVGPALETLPTLAGPFDLVFIDADKENNAAYLRLALERCAPGALVVVDNVVRDGRVAEAPDHDDSPAVRGVREVVALVAGEPRLEVVTALQTVGVKGWDGMLLARVQG